MATPKKINLNASYAVGANNISLTVIIGDAQIGQSIVVLDSTTMGSGDIMNLALGTGAAIKGKVLTVKSVVTDVNSNTINMSVTYQLRGGTMAQDFLSSGTVDNQGDSMVFIATINLN
jgi:homoaconitase/3-isopropylmalate dehydratase large subunit